MKALILTIAVCTALLAAACGSEEPESANGGAVTEGELFSQENGEANSNEGTATRTKPTVEVPSGEPPKQLGVEDLEEGTGAAAKAGDEVTVQYVGVGYESEEEFDSSWSRSEPFTFTLGKGEVIPGWDQGIEGMKVGGRRELVIPPQLAYGSQGSPPAIGPNETLIFVIDLLQAL